MKKLIKTLITTVTLISIALIWEKLYNFDIVQYSQRWEFYLTILTFILCLIFQNILQAFRLKKILNLFDVGLTIKNTWIICNLGGVTSFTPASFLLGDAIRFLKLKQLNLENKLIIKILLIDRIVGVFAIFTVFLIFSFIMFFSHIKFENTFANFKLNIYYVSIIISTYILIIWLKKLYLNIYIEKIINKFLDKKFIINNCFKIIKIFIISIIMSLFPILGSIIFTFLLYSIEHITDIITITSAVAFLTLIPMTIQGIGYREGLFWYLFEYFQLDPEKGVLLGVLISFSIISSHIPFISYYIFGGYKHKIDHA